MAIMSMMIKSAASSELIAAVLSVLDTVTMFRFSLRYMYTC